MSYVNNDALVEPDWLATRLGTENLAVIDASWFLPPTDRDARAEFAAGHIPGAVYFDIDEIVDPAATLPHTLPAPEDFAAKVGAMGIGNATQVIVYDAVGAFSAPRVWWMFRVMGHRAVAVLSGGLPAWKEAGHPLTDDLPAIVPTDFAARLDGTLVASLDDVTGALGSATSQVLDARAAGRFAGRDPEPRPGVRSGHMPGAFNLHYAKLLDTYGGRFKTADELDDLFSQAGIDPVRKVITSCGSGVTACILSLALYLLGRENWAVYDGSWSEWGGREDTDVEVET